MTCRQLIDFLTDYLDGRLPFGQRLTFEAHLALCRHCRAYLHNFRSSMAACRQACGCRGAQPEPELPAELVDAILKSATGEPPTG